jgi:hypothetical protein
MINSKYNVIFVNLKLFKSQGPFAYALNDIRKKKYLEKSNQEKKYQKKSIWLCIIIIMVWQKYYIVYNY